jgi:class 3 adenylate cyclase
MPKTTQFDSELGAFLDEICADLCRFECAATAGCAPAQVSVEREVALKPDAYADMRVEWPGAPGFFVENKLEYAPGALVERIRYKYGEPSPAWRGAQRLVVILDRSAIPQWSAFEAALRAAPAPGLAIEIWDVDDLLARIRATFGHEITVISRTNLLDVRTAIEQAQWRLAFDGKFPDDPRASTLLWHLSPWELGRLYREGNLMPDGILEPGTYEEAVVVMADMCSFSSYVRDTRDAGLIRRRLTEYYSLARYAVQNAGGMLYQFVGDEVVGVFGLHRPLAIATVQALGCVRALFAAGNAVSNAWQRALDRVQPSRGVHIGIAMGDLDLMPFRPVSRTHLGFMGEPLNLAARLMGEAKSDEAVATNTFYAGLDDSQSRLFEAIEPIEAKNVGRIRAWRTTQRALEAADPGH